MLWDRGESNGYARYMTSRALPRTPKHEVLLHVALGDHQVAPVTADVMARTIGARVWDKLDPGRSTDEEPFHGARGQVLTAARRETDDDLDAAFRRPALGRGGGRQAGQRQRKQRALESHVTGSQWQ